MTNQKGFTLIELLATIVISSIVIVLATSLLISAMNTQKTVSAKVVLRDEADIIMANLLKAVYTTKESEVTFVKEPNNNNYYFKRNTDSTVLTGFKDKKIYIKGSELNINDSTVKIIWQETDGAGNKKNLTEISQNQNDKLNRSYNISLTLETTTKPNIRKTFTTEVSTINDLIIESEED